MFSIGTIKDECRYRLVRLDCSDKSLVKVNNSSCTRPQMVSAMVTCTGVASRSPSFVPVSEYIMLNLLRSANATISAFRRHCCKQPERAFVWIDPSVVLHVARVLHALGCVI